MTEWTEGSNFVSVADVRALVCNYPEMDTWLVANGETVTDEERIARQNTIIERYIGAMQRRMETELHLRYDILRIKSRDPNGSEQDDAPTGYDIYEDPYDYNVSDYRHYGFLNLRKRPVLSVQSVRLSLGPLTNIITYPDSWVRVDRPAGRLNILPIPGVGWSGVQLASGAFMLPSILGGWVSDTTPQVLMVDYTVGVGERPANSKHDWINHWLHMTQMAARNVLIEISDVIKPGLTGETISEDGISQSRQFTRGGNIKYAGKINQYFEDYEVFRKSHQGDTSPFIMRTV